ncbi:MAG TPA: DNA ligase D [Thermoanaerobaculia bacterium]|nr:DNA ligase D [Thermoanaerobaculia bacterium]
MKPNNRSKRVPKELAREIEAELLRLGAPRQAVDPGAFHVMKPETSDRPFSRPGWIFELKYDGFRMLAAGGAGEARLAYRSGMEATRIFPEIAAAVAALPFAGLLLDGEAVVLDEAGHPSFQKLQRRGLRTRAADTLRAGVDSPAALFVFDLLACEGFDLRPLPLLQRKEILARVLAGVEGPVRYLDHVPERGADLYAAVESLGLEGIVAKREDSPYRSGYSKDWLKVRVDRTCDFAVVGFDPVPNAKAGFRRLHLAVRDGGTGLAYVGTVGTGFDREDMADLRPRLEAARRATPPVSVAAGRGTVWVEPQAVVEVRYKEQTEDGHLRHPVFLRVRDDKTVDECFRPGEEPEESGGAPAPAPDPVPEAGRAVKLTNLDKVFWPEEGYTKGDLLEYYRSVSPWMLTFLRDRPLVLDRYPNGITGKSFYQKNAPDASRVRTVSIHSDGSGRAIDYFLCDDEASLLYLVNLGAIPFHVWASRVESLERPDWCILDLDPKTAPFKDVVTIALAIRELCEEIEIPCFIKTSGGSGLHVLLPMGARLPHDPVRQLAELLAQVIVARLPAIATTQRSIPKRRGKVYVDALQNGRGKLLAAPYTVRPRPGATVSTPLLWSEVGPRLDVREFDLKSVPKRLRKMKEDPLLPVLGEAPDLARTLDLLSRLI